MTSPKSPFKPMCFLFAILSGPDEFVYTPVPSVKKQGVSEKGTHICPVAHEKGMSGWKTKQELER